MAETTIIKRYVIEDIQTIKEDGSVERRLRRTNDGFSSFELLGILVHAHHEVQQQIDGVLSPITERKVIIP